MATSFFPYDGPVVTRDEARAAGLKRYFLGYPCLHGHIAQRITSNGSCMECARNRRHAWAKANRQKINAWKKQPTYQERDRERRRRRMMETPDLVRQQRKGWQVDKDKLKARKRSYQLKNKHRIKEYLQKWHQQNAEYARQQNLKWLADNPEAARLINLRRKSKRRALERAAGDYVLSKSDIARMLHNQNNRCLGCGRDISLEYTIDHNIPLSKGGLHLPENIQLLCHLCNSVKGARTMDEWLECRALKT